MKAYKCDRCGVYTTHKLNMITFENFLYKPVYELCEDCRKDFLKWMKQKDVADEVSQNKKSE